MTFVKNICWLLLSHAKLAPKNQVAPNKRLQLLEHLNMFVNIHFPYKYFCISEISKSPGAILSRNELCKVLRHPTKFQLIGVYCVDYRDRCKKYVFILLFGNLQVPILLRSSVQCFRNPLSTSQRLCCKKNGSIGFKTQETSTDEFRSKSEGRFVRLDIYIYIYMNII